MNKYLLPSLLIGGFFMIKSNLFCQQNPDFTFPNGAKAAICLTYDDGLPSHIHTVVPALDKYGLKGTFYITLSSSSVKEEMEKWKQLATNGHELGNHSVYHPCQASQPGMDWVKPQYDLDHYSVEQMIAEIQVGNSFLQALDGDTVRTFAYPCGHFLAGGESYIEALKTQSTAARGAAYGQSNFPSPRDIDPYRVPAWSPSNVEGKDLIAYIESVIKHQTLSTLCFHGVGAEYLSVSKEAHEELLQYLAAHRSEIWVATFKEATDFLISKRQ